jgi:hypothetical protein
MEEDFCAFKDLQYGDILMITSKYILAALDEATAEFNLTSFGVCFHIHITQLIPF